MQVLLFADPYLKNHNVVIAPRKRNFYWLKAISYFLRSLVIERNTVPHKDFREFQGLWRAQTFCSANHEYTATMHKFLLATLVAYVALVSSLPDDDAGI